MRFAEQKIVPKGRIRRTMSLGSSSRRFPHDEVELGEPPQLGLPPQLGGVAPQQQTVFYATTFSGVGSQPIAWHGIRGKKPPTDRLVKSQSPRPLAAPVVRCTTPRPPPHPVPLLTRTTPSWAPATTKGMRVPLRDVATPGDSLRAILNNPQRQADNDELGFEMPPTSWRALYGRPDLLSPSSDHGTDVPSSAKAKARRLASVINQHPRSRHHAHNAPLSRLATAI